MTWLKTLLFTLTVPGSLTVYVPYWLLGVTGAQPNLQSWRGVLGCAWLLIGAAIYGWCAWDFTFAGRGTPAPIDPPKEMVVRGLYRYSRNPMYVGVLSVLLGEVLLFRSWRLFAYVVAIATIFQLFVTLYEEPGLQRRFGASYAAYCQRVPRWFWR